MTNLPKYLAWLPGVLFASAAWVGASAPAISAADGATAHRIPSGDSLATVHGSVTAEGAGVPGANVFLLETLEGVLADADGRFALTSRHRGPATLVVRLMGYRERRRAVVLPQRESVTIAMEVNAIEMAPMVVQ